MMTLLLILGIIGLLLGFGYFGFRMIEKKKEESSFATPRRSSKQFSFLEQRIPQKSSPQLQKKIEFHLKQRDAEKEKERKQIFGAFDEKQKSETSKIIYTEKPSIAPKIPEKQEIKDTKRTNKKHLKPKKTKEDAFVKLKEVAQDHKTKKRGKKKKT